MSRRCLCLASLIAIAAAAPVYAQTIDTPATAAAAPIAAGEIIVTAQRRSERLKDVPLSITAIPAVEFQAGGLTTVDSLTRAAPGVVIDRLGAYLQPTIRGIGSNVTGTGADPAVAIYVDGVYQPSGTSAFFDLPNVEQLEILKGPQGTLFGRNSTGGAILIKTFDPSFDASGKVTAAYGNMNEYSASAYGTGPINDKIAVNLSTYYRHSDGWMFDLKTGDKRNEQHAFSTKGKLLFKPTERFSLLLSASYDDLSDPTGTVSVAYKGNTQARPLPNSGPIASARGDVSHDYLTRIKAKVQEYAAHGSLDLDFATLKTITAYRYEDGFVTVDLDATYAPLQSAAYHQIYKTFSQEATLTSPSGQPFTWVAGAFYFKQKAYYPKPLGFTVNGNPSFNSEEKDDAISAFADGTYEFGRFSVFGGLRYSTEKKNHLWGAGLNPFSVDASTRFSQLSPRAGARFKLNEDSNIYASFNRGFKSGTYNQSSSSTIPVKAESVDSYEVGFKTAHGPFFFNAAAFYSSYDQIQVTAYDYTQGISRLVNAAKAKIYGAEIDGQVKVGSNLTLRAAASYLHTEYSDFPGAILFTPRPGGLTGNITTIGDASGAQMIRAPKFSMSGTITYRVPVGRGDVSIQLSPYYSSKVNYSFDERVFQPHYFTLDGNVTWQINTNLKASLYGRNVTDKIYASFLSEASIRDTIVYARPRTFGASMAYTF